MRTKKTKIEINDLDFFEDCLWMSYRYCIGRQTIAAHGHAGDIAQNAYHVLSDERKSFMASDIRREINDVINGCNNIKCYDYSNHIVQDGLSTLLYSASENLDKDVDLDDYSYEVDGQNVKIELSKRDNESYYKKLSYLYSDLIVWIKLANAFDKDCHKTIVIEYDGKVEEHECFSYPYMEHNGNNISKKWISVERYLTNPLIDSYYNEEYIKEIK